jgi:hypothetical protein
MDELFSCRNCIHNCVQSLRVGVGAGFCLQHNSVIREPAETTCKYLHRKDLPKFLVDEGIREHAAEFALFSGMASLRTREPVSLVKYSERYSWEAGEFDPLLHSIAQYHRTNPAWVFVQTLTGGIDGRRMLAQAAMVRRYVEHCGTWKSSYRLVLGFLQEIAANPTFDAGSLVPAPGSTPEELLDDAVWDVVFTKLSGLQEYGWHAALEDLMWVTDTLNGALADLDWPKLRAQLIVLIPRFTHQIIEHAKRENAYFPSWPDQETEDLPVEFHP